jgi:hypothetical protein
MHMTFGRLGEVDAAAKMSGMEAALPAVRTYRLGVAPATLVRLGLTILVVGLGFAIAFRGDGGDPAQHVHRHSGVLGV